MWGLVSRRVPRSGGEALLRTLGASLASSAASKSSSSNGNSSSRGGPFSDLSAPTTRTKPHIFDAKRRERAAPGPEKLVRVDTIERLPAAKTSQQLRPEMLEQLSNLSRPLESLSSRSAFELDEVASPEPEDAELTTTDHLKSKEQLAAVRTAFASMHVDEMANELTHALHLAVRVHDGFIPR